MLKKRPDPSRGGTLRWSLPYDEICLCQRVVAPRWQKTCLRKEDPMACSADSLSCILWFVDDPTQLTQRQNWNKETLDRLLERADHCGKYKIYKLFCATNSCSSQLQILTRLTTPKSDTAACTHVESRSTQSIDLEPIILEPYVITKVNGSQMLSVIF